MTKADDKNAVTYLDKEEARIIYLHLISGIEEYELSNGEKGGLGPYGVHVARRAARKMCPIDYEKSIKEIDKLKNKLKTLIAESPCSSSMNEEFWKDKRQWKMKKFTP